MGVLFSGGVDQTLIAFLLKKAGADFTCITSAFKTGTRKSPKTSNRKPRIAKELD